jgi:hypothetical protein
MNQKKHIKARLLTMDELRARPCEIDGRPALFHRWIEEDDERLWVPTYLSQIQVDQIIGAYKTSRIIPGNCELTVVHHTFALVEYRNGTIAKVEPERVKFTDKEGLA